MFIVVVRRPALRGNKDANNNMVGALTFVSFCSADRVCFAKWLVNTNTVMEEPAMTSHCIWLRHAVANGDKTMVKSFLRKGIKY